MNFVNYMLIIILVIIIMFCIMFKFYKESFFVTDDRLLLEQDGLKYIQSLNNVYDWLNNSNYRNKIDNKLEILNNHRKNAKSQILDGLTNLYLEAYMEQISKANAEAYKTFLKYNNPQKNKYYMQYVS